MMNKRMRTSLLALAAVVGALALVSPAHAQATGGTDVDISLPDIVILHYYSNVDVTISAAALATYLTGGTNAIDEGTAAPAAGGMTQDLAISPSALTGDPTAAVLTLQNAWAVRSISLAGSTDTELAISVTDNTLVHSTVATSTVTISSAAVDDGASNGATIQWAAQGLGNPRQGDVELTLDLSDAANAGDYLDGTFTLTATNI